MVESGDGRVSCKAGALLTRAESVAAPAANFSFCPTRMTQNLPRRTVPGKQLLECVWDFKVRIL